MLRDRCGTVACFIEYRFGPFHNLVLRHNEKVIGFVRILPLPVVNKVCVGVPMNSRREGRTLLDDKLDYLFGRDLEVEAIEVGQALIRLRSLDQFGGPFRVLGGGQVSLV